MLWGEPTFTFIHLAHLPVIPDSLTIGGGHTPQLQDGITRLHSSQQQKENGLLYLVSLDTSNQKKHSGIRPQSAALVYHPMSMTTSTYSKRLSWFYTRKVKQNVISYVYVMSLLSRSFWNFSSWHNAKNKTTRISTRCVHAHVCFCDEELHYTLLQLRNTSSPASTETLHALIHQALQTTTSQRPVCSQEHWQNTLLLKRTNLVILKYNSSGHFSLTLHQFFTCCKWK